jgi:hypothetical protein
MKTMNAETNAPAGSIVAERIPDGDQKMAVLPRHFGRHMLKVEDAVYAFMRHLVTEYRGGFWHFYELSNGGFYMAPEMDPVQVRVESNGYEGRMSADAAGITACLFAFSHLSFEVNSDVLTRHYYMLRNFALEHAEAKEILAAID